MLKTKVKNEKNTIGVDEILIKNNLVNIQGDVNGSISKPSIATICANLTYYGYILSKKSMDALMKLDEDTASNWWAKFEPVLKKITGDDKNIADFVVYKNFPNEVLDMSQTEYWINQVFMYMGFDNELFQEDVEEREPMLDKLNLKVLNLSNDSSLSKILNSLTSLPAKWTDEQFDNVFFLVNDLGLVININDIPFKENQIGLISSLFEADNISNIKLSATDVLRLAIGMSDGDISMKTNSKFRNFKRSERKMFLTFLEKSSNLEEDFARNSERFKKFLFKVHPNDYRKDFPKTCEAYDKLYNNKVKTFDAKVEAFIESKDSKVFGLLKSRPGEFMRRLNAMVTIFGKEASTEFISVADKLTVSQLLKLEMYFSTINDRKFRTVAPTGNWTKLQILENNIKVDDTIRVDLTNAIQEVIRTKIQEGLGADTINLSESAKLVKLQTNDSELTTYGRGTVFPIPDNINFIRSASYWKETSGYGNTWYDNGWNFFDEDWKGVAVCSWDNTSVSIDNKVVSAFSGDPTNSKDVEGRACQMIDLYLDKLANSNVRYAVWNILCYSQKSFNEAEEVFGALQWGEDAQKGELFEPSRNQLSFELNGSNLTKYVAYVDIKERKIVYMDANLYGNVQSAKNNQSTLAEKMPAFVEYLDTLPSVYDMFKGVKNDEDGVCVSYDDKDVELKNGQDAFIFKPVNENNDFTQLDLNNLLL